MSYYMWNLKWRNIHYQTSKSYSPAACSSIQKFDNDCDVIFMFKMYYNEYDIIFPPFKRLEESCLVSENRLWALQWFQNVTSTTWPVIGTVTSMHCKGFLERWFTFEVPTSLFLSCFPSSSVYVYQYFTAKSDRGWWGKSAWYYG